MEEMLTITDLFIYRGEGLEGLIDRYGDTEKVRILKVALKTNQCEEGIIQHQVGPLILKENQSRYLDQTLEKVEILDLIEHLSDYDELIKLKHQDYTFIERTYPTELYIEDKETHYAAEFTLISPDKKIPTDKYKYRGIKAINPNFKCAFEFTGNLYRLSNGKLKKDITLEKTERTKPQLLRYIPNVYEVTYAKTCNIGKETKIIPKELSCVFDGETTKEVEN